MLLVCYDVTYFNLPHSTTLAFLALLIKFDIPHIIQIRQCHVSHFLIFTVIGIIDYHLSFCCCSQSPVLKQIMADTSSFVFIIATAASILCALSVANSFTSSTCWHPPTSCRGGKWSIHRHPPSSDLYVINDIDFHSPDKYFSISSK